MRRVAVVAVGALVAVGLVLSGLTSVVYARQPRTFHVLRSRVVPYPEAEVRRRIVDVRRIEGWWEARHPHHRPSATFSPATQGAGAWLTLASDDGTWTLRVLEAEQRRVRLGLDFTSAVSSSSSELTFDLEALGPTSTRISATARGKLSGGRRLLWQLWGLGAAYEESVARQLERLESECAPGALVPP